MKSHCLSSLDLIMCQQMSVPLPHVWTQAWRKRLAVLRNVFVNCCVAFLWSWFWSGAGGGAGGAGEGGAYQDQQRHSSDRESASGPPWKGASNSSTHSRPPIVVRTMISNQSLVCGMH